MCDNVTLLSTVSIILSRQKVVHFFGMDPTEITNYLRMFSSKKERTIVIVDFGNVEKWRNTLGWRVGIQELARLTKSFAYGDTSLRRFYYGSDYGPKERSPMLTLWSSGILTRARMNRFEVVTKSVKYIHDQSQGGGYEKKRMGSLLTSLVREATWVGR